MKKKLALLLSAVMIVGMIPMTAFAISDNSVDRVVTSTTDKELTTIPVLKMEKKNLDDATNVTFKLTLTNAEWKGFGLSDIKIDGVTATAPIPETPQGTANYVDADGVEIPTFTTKASATDPLLTGGAVVVYNNGTKSGQNVQYSGLDVHKVTLSGVVKYYVVDTDPYELTTGPVETFTTPSVPATPGTKITMLSDSSVIIELNKATKKDSKIEVALRTKVKSDGDATVTIDPMESVLSAGTYKFANVSGGSTITTIEKKTDLQEAGSKIKSIVVTEAAAGSLKGSTSGEFKLKLTNGFEFTDVAKIKVSSYPDLGTAVVKSDADNQEVYVKFPKLSTAGFGTSQAATISFSDIYVGYDEDDVEIGDIAEITVSGYDMTKATVEVGTAVSYGVVVEAENKTLPTFVAGRYADDEETLKVTFKETVRGSWLDNRKTTISFPEGVKATIESVTVKDGISSGLAISDFAVDQKEDKTEITLPKDIVRNSDKAKFEIKFNISADPSFTGDIKALFGGAGLDKDQEVVIGTVVAPITVEAETNEVSIDYRNVAVGDILIKETEAGYLKKDTVLYLGLEYLDFDGTPKVEVVEGDIKIDKVKVERVGDSDAIAIYIKTASNKTPAVLKVTDNQLFLGRSIPAGSYELSLVAGGIVEKPSSSDIDSNGLVKTDKIKDAIFRNYVDSSKKTLGFDTDEVVVLKDFVEVVTAGRDQDDSTFTTKISVTIGADKLVAGKTEIALDVPAYISEGYTMLPVRAVTEALSGKAIVRWDDSTKTVTITFGSRVVSMTVGSKVMNINGVAVQMSKACEITDSRAFIPLRDLGYALGLNDSKINWDDATKTATLN